MEQSETLDANIITECEKYIETRKKEKEEENITPDKNKRIGFNKRGTIVDTIHDLINEYNIKTYGDWELKIDCDIKDQLLRDYGLQADTYAHRIIRNNKHKEAAAIKYKTFEASILESLQNIDTTNFSQHYENIKWILYLFKSNDIKPEEYLYWITNIKNMTFTKINGLVLQGFTNAGKSLLIDITIASLKPEEIPRERDNNGFHLDQLPFASAALFEEPMITPINVGTWKLLLEGKSIKTDIKHKDKEGIERLPIYITTATPITSTIDRREAEQIEQRIKIFKFKSTIEHRKYTEGLEVSDCHNILKKPPNYLTTTDMAILYVLTYTDIIKLDSTITYTKNPSRLSPSEEETKQLIEYKNIYEKLWADEEIKEEIQRQKTTMTNTTITTPIGEETLDWLDLLEEEARDTENI